MNTPKLFVREIQATDIPLITDYWVTAEPAYLTGMGVDLAKMPTRRQWLNMLPQQLATDYHQKQSYCIIWSVNERPIGHCNVNQIIFGEQAFMHLHIWYAEIRSLGIGAGLVKMTLPYFFTNLQLKKVCCEPYALNPSPNKALAKAGFQFIDEYITTPGSLNFEQLVSRWEITKEAVMR